MQPINLNTDFKSMKMVQLKEIAKEMHICKWYNMNKQPLIEAILFELKNEYITEFTFKNKCNVMVIKGKRTMKCSNEIDENEKFCFDHKEQYKFEKPSECSICFDSLDEKQIPLKCGHWFHKDCIKKTEKHTCPLCRKQMTNDELKFFCLVTQLDPLENYFENMRQIERNLTEQFRQSRETEIQRQTQQQSIIQQFASNFMRLFGY